MSLEQIQALQLDRGTVYEILTRILDITNLAPGESLYTLNEDESLDFYDRIMINPAFTKPALAVMEAELELYKEELTLIEQARLDEIARVQDINTRFNAIKDIRGVFARAGLSIGNPALELRRIIEENDQARLSLLESTYTDLLSDQVIEETAKAEMAIADGLVELCLGCVKIVMKHNIRNSLSKEQKDQQALDYSDVFNALKEWRPGKFKSAVNALTPDGVLVKQDLKDELISFLTSNGL